MGVIMKSINWKKDPCIDIALHLFQMPVDDAQNSLFQRYDYYRRAGNEDMLSKINTVRECLDYLNAKVTVSEFEAEHGQTLYRLLQDTLRK